MGVFSKRGSKEKQLLWWLDLHHQTLFFVSTATKMHDQNSGLTLPSDLWLLAILVRDVTVFSKSGLCLQSLVLKQGTGHSWMLESGEWAIPHDLTASSTSMALSACVFCSHETGLGFAVVWWAEKKPVWLTHSPEQQSVVRQKINGDLHVFRLWRRILQFTHSDYCKNCMTLWK